MLSGKFMVTCLIIGLMKKILHKISYYSEPDSNNRSKIIVVLDLASLERKYATEKATGAGKSKFAKKSDLDGLKSDVDKLGINKLKNVSDKTKTIPTDLKKLNDVTNKDAVKKKHCMKKANVKCKWKDNCYKGKCYW